MCDATWIRRIFPRTKPSISENPPEAPAVTPESPTEGPTASEGSPPAKRPVSVRKIQANRSNALKSPGPTSRAGKNRVRWNSYKHGLLAKALFSRPIDGEKPADFYRFLKDLRRDIEPVGIREEMHGQGAAVCFWLIQRSLRCEGGEIKKKSASAYRTWRRGPSRGFGQCGNDGDRRPPQHPDRFRFRQNIALPHDRA